MSKLKYVKMWSAAPREERAFHETLSICAHEMKWRIRDCYVGLSCWVRSVEVIALHFARSFTYTHGLGFALLCTHKLSAVETSCVVGGWMNAREGDRKIEVVRWDCGHSTMYYHECHRATITDCWSLQAFISDIVDRRTRQTIKWQATTIIISSSIGSGWQCAISVVADSHERKYRVILGRRILRVGNGIF